MELSFIHFCLRLLVISYHVYLSNGRLLLILSEGFAGTYYHKYAHLNAFKEFEEKGVALDMLYPVFPSLSLPNQYSLVTGKLPKNHGIVGDFMRIDGTDQYFMGGTHIFDYSTHWWNKSTPIWVTTELQNISTAMYFWPGCQVDFQPTVSFCSPYLFRSDRPTLSMKNIGTVLTATNHHEFVMAYHNKIALEGMYRGPAYLLEAADIKRDYTNSVMEFSKILEEALVHQKLHPDLNILVVSDHGLMDVPRENVRYLEDYINLDTLDLTIGMGAIKQISARPGLEHSTFNTLRNERPIPNVRVYYTTPRMTDMPKWFDYPESPRIAEILLVAEPGYCILTKRREKQLPQPSDNDWQPGMSGYDNHWPDMLGILFALGPAFDSYSKPKVGNILDVHPLICQILSIKCPEGDGKLLLSSIIAKHHKLYSDNNAASTIYSNRYFMNMFYCVVILLDFLCCGVVSNCV